MSLHPMQPGFFDKFRSIIELVKDLRSFDKAEVDYIEKNIAYTLESHEGKFLAPSNCFFNRFRRRAMISEKVYRLIEPNTDGSIPQNAMFPCFGSKSGWGDESMEVLQEEVRQTCACVLGNRKRHKQWPLYEELIDIQIRSPVPDLPPCDKLVVSQNGSVHSFIESEAGNEYCLAAGKGGTIKWLHESKCKDGNNVWTLRFIDYHGRDENMGTGTDMGTGTVINEYKNCVVNNVGNNVNGSGTQTVGRVCLN